MRLPENAPTLEDLLGRVHLEPEKLPAILRAGSETFERSAYPHWEQIRRAPVPEGLTKEQFWLGIKFAREGMLQPIPLHAASGAPFRYSMPDPVLELLHWIDQHAAGEIAVSEAIPNASDRRRYLVSSLIEESISSSQLEGAMTTRKVAKEMLRTGRKPRDRDEQMILNNYRAMSELGRLKNAPLSADVVYGLHRTLTEGTLDDPEAAGRPQRPGDERVRVFAPDGTVVHVPPAADELDGRMIGMVDFANAKGPGRFMHPAIRAILLHLWLAYDHPFEDGNGRTARALFYREMLGGGYWLFEYVSISRLLMQAPAQYARAFLHTERDEFDATYFILHQLGVMRRAIEELMAYLQRKMREVRQTIELLRRTELNNRQIALISHALRHPDTRYSVTSHSGSHRVTRQSARTDLMDLERRGLLIHRTAGKQFEFYAVPDIAARVQALS